MQSDLKIIDPVWTTAYVVRNHGYMIYDTLFALDEKREIKPQMVDSWTVSDDKLVWTFTLREGLLWHDGLPVKAEDCVASIKRWAVRDPGGQTMMTYVDTIEALDDRRFAVRLKQPFGMLLDLFAKPNPYTLFMMPKRVAETPPDQQLSDTTGSGPFVFKRDEWAPGNKVVYVKFDKYKPRSEPPSGLAGAKKVEVDRVEWVSMPDTQTAVAALQAGEIDYIETFTPDLAPLLDGQPNVELIIRRGVPWQYAMRFNWLQKPFDNEKIRRAALLALNREDFTKAAIGDPRFQRDCKTIYTCGSPYETDAGTAGILESRFDEAKALLKEAGYDGTPVVLLHSTDLAVLTNLAPVARDLLIKGGFKVDMQSMDWQTLVTRRAKKGPPSEGGWNAFITAWSAFDAADPVSALYFSGACEKATFGWPCDAELERLKGEFIREIDPAKRKAIAEAVQVRVLQVVTYAPLGEFFQLGARSKALGGFNTDLAPVFWGVTKSRK